LKKIEVRGWGGKDTITFEYNRPAQREGDRPAIGVSDFKFITGNETRLPANLDVEIFGGSRDDELKVDGSGDKAWGGTYALNPVSLHGGAGDDTIVGSIGDELLEGGTGNDTLIGNEGSDELLGNGGHDTLFGDSDIAPYAGDGNDKLFGHAGVDTMHGGGGDDMLVGGSGNDFLHGDGDDDTLFGDQGVDSEIGFIGCDHLYGGDGDDILFGQAGDDYLNGEGDSDRLSGQLGNDTLIGGPAGDGRDFLHGGANADVFRVDHYQGVAQDKVEDFREGEDELVKTGDVDPGGPQAESGSGGGSGPAVDPGGPDPPKQGDQTIIGGGRLPLAL
jgi:Ca2+-binding RTX toxin-like protein